MSFTLVFLALLMGAVSWWLIRQTVNVEPWAASPKTDDVRSTGVLIPGTGIALPNVKLGLGVFLAVATSLFALFISAYSIRMEYPDWRPATEPTLLWFNTLLLVLSSVFLQWGWSAASKGKRQLTWRCVGIGTFFALAFIVGQLIAWDRFAAAGYLIHGNPANAFFYLLTGIHALHLFGGLIALGKSVVRIWRDDTMAKVALGVELCAVYWHYLLAIWLILFAMMLAT